MLTVSTCPVCSGTKFSELGSATDHTVSKENFSLMSCTHCGLTITSPRPLDQDLPGYYLSPTYISHNAKASTLFDKLYETTRQFALKWKLTLVKKYSLEGSSKILDYGCGTGYFLKKMKDAGFRIEGVEPSDTARTAAKSIAGIPIAATISEIKTDFDVITLWHVLEHVSDLNSLMTDLKNRLKKSGTLFIAVPNCKSPDALHYGTGWAGYDVPRHLWHFDQQSMARLLANHKLQLIATVPMKLDAFYVSMLSEKYISGHQTVVTFMKGLTNGFLSNLKAKNKNYSSLIYIARHHETTL